MPAPTSHAAFEIADVIVVGAGPVGTRVIQELHRLRPALRLVLVGDEPCLPYNRVRLSSALAGEVSWDSLAADSRVPEHANVMARYGCRIEAIDRSAREVVAAGGARMRYRHLVLALGSRPVVPALPGMQLAGVFTLRDMRDAQRLAARMVRSRHTIIVGGGLLGLEAARAMRRHHTRVTVIDHADRLMARQLDTEGGGLLAQRIAALGIEVLVGDGLLRVDGEDSVAGITLRSGRQVHADTLVVAAGIRPNVEIARAAGLQVGHGIRVDDLLRTNDPAIFAVGECAEHRGAVYGLLAPGYEQAAVVANAIAGIGQVRYAGSTSATKLKVMSCPVFSIGDTGNEGLSNFDRVHRFRDPRNGVYRKLVLNRGRLTGAMAVGDWDEVGRLQEAVLRGRYVLPWQRTRFERCGSVWGDELGADVGAWPADATVCNCTGVTRGQLAEAMRKGCASVDALAGCTGASSVCGTCKPLLAQLVGAQASAQPVRGARTIALLGAGAIAAAALLLLPGLPYADTVQGDVHWDRLWRDGAWKQVSGFSLLALMLALGALGLRKRWSFPAFGAFDLWRLVHVVLGMAVVAGLVVHTGGRTAGHLNAALSICVVGLALGGGIASWVLGREHEMDGARARAWRSTALWSHILLLWPLPVLIAFHVLKTYWF